MYTELDQSIIQVLFIYTIYVHCYVWIEIYKYEFIRYIVNIYNKYLKLSS